MTIEHSAIADPYIHEPKGAAAADEGKVYKANGAGSGNWTRLSGWKDKEISGFAIGDSPSLNPPSITSFRDGLYLYGFPNSGTTEGYAALHLPHDFKQGSTCYFHVHWTHKEAAPSGNVKWFLEVSYARGYEKDVFPASSTLSTVDAAGAQYTHHITTDTDMTFTPATEIEPDAMVILRLYRNAADGSDTFNGSALLMGVDMHYQTDQEATFARNRPFLDEGFAA